MTASWKGHPEEYTKQNGSFAISPVIREELPGDREGIRMVNLLAFGQKAEADLVDLLRTNGKMRLSSLRRREIR